MNIGRMDFMASIMRELNTNLAASKRPITEMMDGERTYKMRDGSEIEVP